ncbi:unnamed protein product, partial [Ectocarpus sp. 12 AP-2014]
HPRPRRDDRSRSSSSNSNSRPCIQQRRSTLIITERERRPQGDGSNCSSSSSSSNTSMASSSSSHQNAAKKIKALLRRTHFPVARLRQLPLVTAAPPSGGLAPTAPAAAGGAGNPWDGIVSGDPRAALVVLHWTLLDMSPLFATLLLDRDYAGLTSLTDFKFVATSLRMLRDEFNCRPQLTAEQFLTSGFAEVKMRLLADIVELVMRTHHSLASQQKNEDGGGATSSSNNNNSNNTSAPVPSAGNGWGSKSDHSSGGRSSGASSPWN